MTVFDPLWGSDSLSLVKTSVKKELSDKLQFVAEASTSRHLDSLKGFQD